MPTLCESCGIEHGFTTSAIRLRAGFCDRCAARRKRELAKLAVVAKFYDPAATIVLGIDVVTHGTD